MWISLAAALPLWFFDNQVYNTLPTVVDSGEHMYFCYYDAENHFASIKFPGREPSAMGVFVPEPYEPADDLYCEARCHP